MTANANYNLSCVGADGAGTCTIITNGVTNANYSVTNLDGAPALVYSSTVALSAGDGSPGM